MRRPVVLPIAFMIALGVVGCGPAALVQVETTIRPDGSCDRSIWQPRGRLLPDEAFTPAWLARWTTVVDVPIPPAFPEMASSSGEAYFHARGAFATPADVPAHFRKGFEDRPDLGAGEMTHAYERTDFGLFVEHRWAETLTNGVTRESFEQARDSLLDLAMPLLAEGVERVYGRDFDVDAALEELARRGRPFFRDLIDAWYDALASGMDSAGASKRLTERFVAAIERAGVDLHDANGRVVNSTEGDRRVRKHVADRVTATFRHKDGSPPTQDDLVAILGGASAPTYTNAWSRFAADRKAIYDAEIVPLLVKMTGYHFFPPLMAPPAPRFAFDVRLPGRVVGEGTNGDLDPTGKVSWRFDATRLYPSGFTMTARSVELDEDAQQRLLGRAALRDLATALSVGDLLADDPELTATLRRAGASGDATLLSETPGMDTRRKLRLARLRGLLGMTP